MTIVVYSFSKYFRCDFAQDQKKLSKNFLKILVKSSLYRIMNLHDQNLFVYQEILEIKIEFILSKSFKL